MQNYWMMRDLTVDKLIQTCCCHAREEKNPLFGDGKNTYFTYSFFANMNTSFIDKSNEIR